MPTPQPQNPSTTSPDPNALAGSPNSLGEESRRDGRPATCDDVVEAIDEEGPEAMRSDQQRNSQ